ncbi:dirigent protein 22-like [Brachypodium distachyon]|uniref:dirigent protein 22-like n=1 Tax=Brachypodium distachyon TaxID=15368 RepID=UPI0001C71A67|nr:dirigent protein 22-like [Brachypodium distachyon]|eukprot:XP_024311050.1 dirigent protein 22-like [Brachypodium distachyon]
MAAAAAAVLFAAVLLLLFSAAAALFAAVLLFFISAGPATPAQVEKETHIKLYWQDILSGPSPTAVQVARAATTNTSKTFFGTVTVIDDPLTAGPGLNTSRIMGRAQGTYVSAGKDTQAFLMNMNFVFAAGEHAGSSVAIMGRSEVAAAVRELAVVGGTGKFRWARGYALARTCSLDVVTGDATVEYNVFVRH